MKSRGVVLIFLIAAINVFVSGCAGAEDEPVALATGREEAQDVASAGVGNPADGDPLPDAVALQLFEELDFWAGADPSSLADVSESVCGIYDIEPDEQFATLSLIKELTDSGMSGEEAGATLVYATGWKCPEHYGKSSLLD